jgi:chromatin structure-remodeling complex subunit RSC9
LNALRSGIPAEQAYATNHLLKISFERGDKFKFESFAGLDEGLIQKVLEVGRLFWEIDFKLSWVADIEPACPGSLDGHEGTPEILEIISSLTPRTVLDAVLPAEFADAMVQINEAAMTIRNMVTLHENALYLSEFPSVKDMICIVLSLPENESVVELKHLTLEIAEQLTPHMKLSAEDPLYRSLISQMDSTDRGTILTALRSLGRISMNLDATNRLQNIPRTMLERIDQWLLLNDDELMDACLDFLYQYTAVVANIENLLQSINTETLVMRLVALLSHGARKFYRETSAPNPERKAPANDTIAPMPPDLLEMLLKIEEPERVHEWIKCFFEDDKDSFVTQISAWQAYQNAFASSLKTAGQSLITPADFIRNSTMVYKDSNAQVLREPGEMQQKFILQGIRPRALPVGIGGAVYQSCLWEDSVAKSNGPKACGQLCATRESMFHHILQHHLKIPQTADGRYVNGEQEVHCRWAKCTKYPNQTKMQLGMFARHIQAEVARSSPPPGSNSNNQRSSNGRAVPTGVSLGYEETLTVRDEKNPNAPAQAAGIPLSAVLVLRNIARNVVKTDSEEELHKQEASGGEPGGWNEKLFRLVRPRLFDILAQNKALVCLIMTRCI